MEIQAEAISAKEYLYDLHKREVDKASALTREVTAMARERGVQLPELIKQLCEHYANSGAEVAMGSGYDAGYNRGTFDCRKEARRQH
jgi:hypothetical protein